MDEIAQRKYTELNRMYEPKEALQAAAREISTLQQQNAQMKEAITHLANWDDEIGSAKRYAQTFIQGDPQ